MYPSTCINPKKSGCQPFNWSGPIQAKVNSVCHRTVIMISYEDHKQSSGRIGKRRDVYDSFKFLPGQRPLSSLPLAIYSKLYGGEHSCVAHS